LERARDSYKAAGGDTKGAMCGRALARHVSAAAPWPVEKREKRTGMKGKGKGKGHGKSGSFSQRSWAKGHGKANRSGDNRGGWHSGGWHSTKW